ncbi:MAG: metallophosphoesterase [bacterium]
MSRFDYLMLATILVVAVVPFVALRARGRPYGIYSLITLLLSLPMACLVFLRLRTVIPPAAWPLADAIYLWGLLASAVHMIALARPRLRSTPFRRLISIPGMAFLAGGALSLPWLLLLLPVRLVLSLLGATAILHTLVWLDIVPALIALASVGTSRGVRWEAVRFRIGEEGPAELTRTPVQRERRPASDGRRPGVLRIVQITDPHLGPWQPLPRLRDRIDRLVDLDPDLVAVTGDLLTMEGAGSAGALEEALAPLRRLPGRCFAVFGNHDHEWPEEIRQALASTGVQLLEDEEAMLDSPAGPVQIVGADYRGKGRAEHIGDLCKRLPRRDNAMRLLLLHDPSAFKHVPENDVDLTLSGHTHGGQIGLLSLGIDWTVLKRSRWPDHGLFARGRSLLYVHRGTGFYGFPLRVGVPGEASRLGVEIPQRPQ